MPVVLAQHQTAQRMEEQIWGKSFFSVISVKRKYFSNWANSNSQSGLEETIINSVLLSLQTTAPGSTNSFLICNGLPLKPNDGSKKSVVFHYLIALAKYLAQYIYS